MNNDTSYAKIERLWRAIEALDEFVLALNRSDICFPGVCEDPDTDAGAIRWRLRTSAIRDTNRLQDRIQLAAWAARERA